MPTRDLSGRWRGFYSQHGHKRPISAVIQQDGEAISGQMNDELTEFGAPIAEMAMEEGLPPGADEQIVEQVDPLPLGVDREGPGGGGSPSRLLAGRRGRRRRRSVLKTYQGPFFAGYRVGDVRVGIAGQDQEVHYRGLLNADGDEIEGQWLLTGEPKQGIVRTEGRFLLRREGSGVDDN